ncbi:MAG: SIS domain-containing protein [Acidimicrobiaceae bacterium]|nr:SIS domain-containing protein [Acidimicrobiaceae bacterium]
MPAIDCTSRPVDAALWLARAFVAGRRLRVHAPLAPDHAHHVAVEFVHPVIAGTRPLEAVVTGDSRGASDETTLAIGDDDSDADLVISDDQPDWAIVLSYHLLWELVQVALEHPGLVGAESAAGGDSTGFLYPFLDAAERDETSLRAALQSSADAKKEQSGRLARESVESNADTLASAAKDIGQTVSDGGRVLTMGNGGSATDAARLTRMLRARGLSAESLCADYAVTSALANDLGAEHMFARQIDAFADAGDVLVGCSTSGASRNLLTAFDRASDIGLTTIGISGYGGGSFDRHESVHHCLAVQSASVHRIQEAQAALLTALCELVDCHLETAVTVPERSR